MQTTNAIKKLSKAGFEVTQNGNRYYATMNKSVVSFIDQYGRTICIKVRHENDHDDLRSDYSAGVFCDNLTQAIKLV